MSSSKELVSANTAYLRQLSHLLSSLGAAKYTRTDTELVPSSVGKHVRHVLDFYGCFLSGLPGGHINYGARTRETDIETDPGAALGRIDRVTEELDGIADEGNANRSVAVSGDAGSAASTVGRELDHLAAHTVHHFALIAAIFRAFRWTIPEDFGKAPSTIRFESGN
jgi:uncharacterized damage-inducible protein DinB